MGLTPLEGLIMGTRSGDIDPAIMEFIAHKEGKNIDEIMTVLNKKSGVYGLSNNLSVIWKMVITEVMSIASAQ